MPSGFVQTTVTGKGASSAAPSSASEATATPAASSAPRTWRAASAIPRTPSKKPARFTPTGGAELGDSLTASLYALQRARGPARRRRRPRRQPVEGVPAAARAGSHAQGAGGAPHPAAPLRAPGG